MYQFLYSIVIPHFNSPHLLQRMLDSIPQRVDIQVIVVDDCSTVDNIEQLKLCHHSNLEIVYLSENQGAGYARNVGLKYIIGKWVIVVDADDVFAANAFDALDKYKDLDVDYLGYCIKCVDTNTLLPNGRKIVSDEAVRKYLDNPTANSLNYYKYKNTVCWNKLVSHTFIKENHIKTTLLGANENFAPSKIQSVIEGKYIFSLCSLGKRKNLEFAIKNFFAFIEKNNISDLKLVLGGSIWNKFKKVLNILPLK